jgi:hypothetical protein
MANTPEVGKINEGVILSTHEDKFNVNSNGERNGFTSPSRRDSKSHPEQLDDTVTDEKHSTIWYCRFVVSHTRLTFGRF